MKPKFHIVMSELPADSANIVAATSFCARINEESFLLARQFAETGHGCGISAPRVVVEELLSRHHQSILASFKVVVKTYTAN